MPVELAVHVAALNASVGVAQHDLHPLFASQLLFVVFLHALFADVVARLVVRVVLDVAL